MATSPRQTKHRLLFSPRLIFPHTITDHAPPSKKRYRPAWRSASRCRGFAGFRKKAGTTVLCREPAWRARKTGTGAVCVLLASLTTYATRRTHSIRYDQRKIKTEVLGKRGSSEHAIVLRLLNNQMSSWHPRPKPRPVWAPVPVFRPSSLVW